MTSLALYIEICMHSGLAACIFMTSSGSVVELAGGRRRRPQSPRPQEPSKYNETKRNPTGQPLSPDHAQVTAGQPARENTTS